MMMMAKAMMIAIEFEVANAIVMETMIAMLVVELAVVVNEMRKSQSNSPTVSTVRRVIVCVWLEPRLLPLRKEHLPIVKLLVRLFHCVLLYANRTRGMVQLVLRK